MCNLPCGESDNEHINLHRPLVKKAGVASQPPPPPPQLFSIAYCKRRDKVGDKATSPIYMPPHLLFPISMMTMLALECCLASSNQVVKCSNVSRLKIV